eukprot:SAG22_NODE_1315_length_4769_cov_23.910064_3_plen_104_part_00
MVQPAGVPTSTLRTAAALLALAAGAARGQTVWPQPASTKPATGGAPAVEFTAFNFSSATDSADGLLQKGFARYHAIILADSGGGGPGRRRRRRAAVPHQVRGP